MEQILGLEVSTIQEHKEGIFRINISGSLDSDTYMILQNEVDRILIKNPLSIVMDMQGLTYISSAGLQVVMYTKMTVNKIGGVVLLVNVHPRIKKVFDIVQILPDMKIFSTVEELDEYLDNLQQ